jgi:hypothetical protein
LSHRVGRVLPFAAICAFLPGLAWSHPGHGEVENGFLHYLIEPVHAVAILAILTAVIGGIVALRRQRNSRVASGQGGCESR